MDSSSTQSNQERSTLVIQSNGVTTTNAIDDKNSLPTSSVRDTLTPAKASWIKWYSALKNTLPVYIFIHLVFFVITCLSVLFSIKDFSTQSVSISFLWKSWLHWDTINFLAIAMNGYTVPWLTSFFPLYPLLERFLMFVTHDPLIAGLIVSDLSGLGMLSVLYRLVEEDFNAEYAFRAVLYLSVFPTAFFFAAAYSESLFLFLTLLSFYHMRHSHWWLAGLFGFLAVLTRSAGLFLLLPFCYEYLRQHMGDRKTSPASILSNVRFDIVSGLCIVAGIAVFAVYCYFLFHDPLAFSHAEATRWDRKLSFPGYALLRTIHAIIISRGILSFQALRNILDLALDLFILMLVILGFVGPWKFPGSLGIYAIFAAAFYLFPLLFPFGGLYPLQANPRFMLAVFPAFIVLAGIGKNRTLNIGYLMISSSLLFFWLTQFLTGHWII
jgi:Gpi18-like mannosyltransferase